MYLRELTENDYNDLCEILQDKNVMYAYEHSFSDAEVKAWYDKQIGWYNEYGYGLWATIDKKNKEFLGQCGLTLQKIDGKEYLEIGYLFKKKHWSKGYATEAVLACRNYAFTELKADKVYSIIRTNNVLSQNVAKRAGMKIEGEIIKHYYNMDMPHYIYAIEAPGNPGPPV
jgi:RimJ/RimL family protein N-acetyltransferase